METETCLNANTNEPRNVVHDQIDDIQLIFTTDENPDNILMKNDDSLVSICDNMVNCNLSNDNDDIINDILDISKCGTGLEQETRPMFNTLLMPSRPIVEDKDKLKPQRESEAQTDISALPWKSESILTPIVYSKPEILLNSNSVTKVITLPSKFLPKTNRPFEINKNRLQIEQKSGQEARRILLSDINFTSMVPEISRSVEQINENLLLKDQTMKKDPINEPISQIVESGKNLDKTSKKFGWSSLSSSSSSATITANSNVFLDTLSGSIGEIPHQPKLIKSNKKFITASSSSLFWNQNQRASFECYQRRQSIDYKAQLKSSMSVPFVSSLSAVHDKFERSSPNKKTFSRDSSPPKFWKPYLPKSINDLKYDDWIKVIHSDGKIKGGFVRLVHSNAPTDEQIKEHFVLIETGANKIQLSDSIYCCNDTKTGLSVPFEKIIMAWSNYELKKKANSLSQTVS